MRLSVKGILSEVDNPQKKDSIEYQYVLIEFPIRDNFTGELKFTEYYPCVIFNENIDSCKAKELQGQKVVADCYLNSYEVEREGKKFRNLRLKVNSLKPIPTTPKQP